ncbi:MAG: tRNA-intron lyase [Candidatus Asgardarchaeia archaeon]
MPKENNRKIKVLFDEEEKMFFIEGDQWRELFDTSFYGTLDVDKKRLILAPFEILYLFEKEKIRVIIKQTHKEINSLEKLIELVSKFRKNVWDEYLIFNDLKSRGYVVKEGISKEIVFSVYGKGKNPLEDTPKFYIFKLSEGLPILLKDIRKITQQALANRKKLIIAVIDRQGDITYYNITPIVF